MTKEFLRGGEEFDLENILQQSGQQRIETSPGKFISISVAPDTINITAENTPFFFRAEVRRGILAINTLLRDDQGNRDSSLPSGKELVRVAMSFLESHQEIKEFHGTWLDPERLDDSSNFNQFLYNYNLLGLSKEDSAWLTWSGQNIAMAYGFTQLMNVFAQLYGNGRFVIAKFARPQQVSP